MFTATAIPPGSGKPVPNLAKRYLARAATSPSPPNVPEPSAPRTSVPLPFTNDEVPSNLMLTIGTATPTSRFSLMPTVLETTSILYDNPRLAVPVRAAPGDAALTTADSQAIEREIVELLVCRCAETRSDADLPLAGGQRAISERRAKRRSCSREQAGGRIQPEDKATTGCAEGRGRYLERRRQPDRFRCGPGTKRSD